ncbi:MAG TPA: 50S ribosomal protein L21 [Candidatus Obscuribacterales bacterium]
MYAIVEASGRQYQLEAGRFVDIDLVKSEPGQPFVFERVLMIVNGKDSKVGKPYLEGAKVNAHVLAHGRERKVIVYKQRPKKGTRKKLGHRQAYTRVYVDSIQLDDEILAEAKAAAVAKTDSGKPAPAIAGKDKAAEPEAKAKAETPAKKAEKPAEKAPAKATKKAQSASKTEAEPKAAKKSSSKPGSKKAE